MDTATLPEHSQFCSNLARPTSRDHSLSSKAICSPFVFMVLQIAFAASPFLSSLSALPPGVPPFSLQNLECGGLACLPQAGRRFRGVQNTSISPRSAISTRGASEKWRCFVHLESGGKTAALQILEAEGGTPGGNADNDERKGLAGKAICMTMKTKGEQNCHSRQVVSGRDVLPGVRAELGSVREAWTYGLESKTAEWRCESVITVHFTPRKSPPKLVGGTKRNHWPFSPERSRRG